MGNAHKMLKKSKEEVELYVQYCPNQDKLKYVCTFLCIFTGIEKKTGRKYFEC